MRREIVLVLAVALAASLAVPAQAQTFDAKMKVTCNALNDDNPEKPKLVKEKLGNDDVVETCLRREELATDPDAVAAHALVFFSNAGQVGDLRVIRRCDSAVVCSFSGVLTSVTADRAVGDLDVLSAARAVIFDLVEIGTGNNGSMICKQSEFFSFATDKLKHKTSCTGILNAEGTPCTLKLTSGRPFEEEETCP